MKESQIEAPRQDAASSLNAANSRADSPSRVQRKPDSPVETIDSKRTSGLSSNPKSPSGDYPHFSPEIVEVSISKLNHHTAYEFVYRDAPDQRLISSIEQWGIMEPLVVSSRGKIIVSGHRRFEAAKHLGLETVPVRYVRHQCQADLQALFLESNQQRLRTPEQQDREVLVGKDAADKRRRWKQDRLQKAESAERLDDNQ